VVIAGTRPEAVKLAPVVLAARRDARFDVALVASGQHPTAVHEALEWFDLESDFTLVCERRDASLTSLFAELLQRVGELLASVSADAVLVQGDTSTALASALASFYHDVPVAHVEAGLRTSDLYKPFPEEAHRRMLSEVTSLHLAPTTGAAARLLREAHARMAIVTTGNTVVDAALAVAERRAPYPTTRLEELDASGRPIVVVTAHRRESWGEPMSRITAALVELQRRYPGVGFVFALHPNPALSAAIAAELAETDVVCTPPVPYGPFTRLLARATLVISDSGGIQEEAPSFDVPVVVLRDETERPEGVALGCAHLVGTATEAIVETTTDLIERSLSGWRPVLVNPYGDGRAAERVVRAIGWQLGIDERPAEFVFDASCPCAQRDHSV